MNDRSAGQAWRGGTLRDGRPPSYKAAAAKKMRHGRLYLGMSR